MQRKVSSFRNNKLRLTIEFALKNKTTKYNLLRCRRVLLGGR